MLQIKIILALVLLAGAGGGYLYVNKLQKDNAILKTNQVKLETAVAESNQVIEQQSKDLKKIRTTLKLVEELEYIGYHVYFDNSYTFLGKFNNNYACIL